MVGGASGDRLPGFLPFFASGISRKRLEDAGGRGFWEGLKHGREPNERRRSVWHPIPFRTALSGPPIRPKAKCAK